MPGRPPPAVDRRDHKRPPARSLYCPAELERIKNEIESFEARPKQIAQTLVNEIHRLASLLDTVTRLSGRSDGASADTWVG